MDIVDKIIKDNPMSQFEVTYTTTCKYLVLVRMPRASNMIIAALPDERPPAGWELVKGKDGVI